MVPAAEMHKCTEHHNNGYVIINYYDLNFNLG